MSLPLWSQIERILSSPDASLPALVKAAGLDPARDFKGIYLNGFPLAEEDISGFDFSYSDLSGTGVGTAKKNFKTKFTGAVADGLSLDPNVIAFNRSLRGLSYQELEKLMLDTIGQNRLRLDVISFSTAINRSPDDRRRAIWHDAMIAAGVTPDVFTYTTLIDKAESDTARTRWHDAMIAAGVTPDVFTYTTLIDKAESDTARTRWHDAMIAAGVTPDVFTYTTLIDKAESDTARTRWHDAMIAAGVTPDVVTYTTLIDKAESDTARIRWHDTMIAAGVTPNDITFSILEKYGLQIDKNENEILFDEGESGLTN